MNGAQDLGGRHGFGAVVPEPEGELFHAEWEPRVLALTLACGALGYWTLDESRHARESLAPATYLTASYYRIWFEALCALLTRHGEVTEEELVIGRKLQDGHRADRAWTAAAVPGIMAKGGPTDRAATAPARFAVGDRVRTRNLQPATHTRLPGYAREKIGTVTALHGAHVFPDTNAHGQGEAPAHLYTVAFEGRDLWGADGDPGLLVSIDAWEPYLETA
ncbi:MAG: nitrile hydratase subunit beta [Pseudomonadota bacterium]